MVGVGPGEKEHVLDDARESTRLVFDDGESFPVLVFLPIFLLQCHRGSSSYDRERRTQFMGSIGHELALLRKGIGQPPQKFVKSGGKMAEFVAWVHNWEPLVEVSGAHPLRLLRHGYYRLQTLACQKPPTPSRQREHEQYGHVKN